MKKILFIVFFSACGAIIGFYISLGLLIIIKSLTNPAEFVDIALYSEENNFSIDSQFTIGNINADYELLFWEFDRQVTKKAEKRTLPAWSINKKRLAYMEKIGEDLDNYPDKNKYFLITINPITLKLKQVYETNSHILDWFWFDDDKIMIYYDTNSGDMFAETIDVKTGQIVNKYLGSDYQWSADKEWYYLEDSDSQNNKITVVDKYQKRIFNYLTENIQYRQRIKAIWSPVANYLGLVRKKDNEDQLELLLVNFDNNGKVLRQKNLGEEGCANMWWDSSNEFICYHPQNGRLEFRL